MLFDELNSFLRQLPAVTVDIKWGNVLVYSVGEKMFAAVRVAPECSAEQPVAASEDGVPRLSFKTEDGLFDILTQKEGIEPAPYLARHKWIMLERTDVLQGEQLCDMLRMAHRLTLSKLSKKKQRELVGDVVS